MPNFEKCEKCGGYGWAPCGCTVFEICREGEDDWQEVYGVGAEDALTKWAEDDDCQGDYTIVSAGENGTLNMLVRDPQRPAEVKRFHVFGETVPQYHARELD
jgi:hypothetical protein